MVAIPIHFQDAPPIPGLRFRHFQGESDYASLASVLTGSENADHLARTVTAENIVRSLQAQKDAGMTESALIADSDSLYDVTRLYESCGFQIVNRDTIYRKAL